MTARPTPLPNPIPEDPMPVPWRSRLAVLLVLALAIPGALRAQEATEDSTAITLAREGLPLKPERKLEFTTREGSWISLDVSPDGKTIVFDLLGDLYTLPIEGGKATPLTQGMAFDAQPRFSPDGKRIVFTSDRGGGENVWILS